MLTIGWLSACTGPVDCEDGFGRNRDGDCVALAGGGGGDETGLGVDDTAVTGSDSGGGDSGGTSSGQPDWALGHPLVETMNLDLESDYFFEGVDAVAVNDQLAILTGQGGWYALDMASGEELMFRAGLRGYDLAYDASTERVWVGTRYSNVGCIDVSDADNPQEGSCGLSALLSGAYEDLAADGGRVLMAAQSQGARLYDDSDTLLATLGDDASAVGLVGDRAVVADADALVLWDVSTADAPVELDRATLPTVGNDIAFDGERVVVAVGGDGVVVYDIVQDTLSDRGGFDVQGSANAVALDGDYAYSASWVGYEVAWVGEGGPVVLGHEPAEQIAFGIAASGGNVAVADWFHARSFRHEPGVAGPEIDAPAYLYFTESGVAEAMTLKNGGAMDLELTIAHSANYAFSTDSVTLAPGESTAVVVTPTGQPPEEALMLTTNDPDEPQVEVRATWGQSLLGEAAEDFEMTGFEWPSEDTNAYRLSHSQGKVRFLAFWAEY